MDVRGLLEQASVLQKNGNINASEECLNQVIAYAARNDEAHYQLACIYFQTGKINDAFASVSVAIAIAPDKASYFNLLGACHLFRREDVAAELCFCHALVLQPLNADACNNLGYLLVTKRRFDEAEVLLTKALSLAPNDVNVMCNLAQHYSKQDKFEQALEFCKQANELQAKNVEPLLVKLSALQGLNRFNEALAVADLILTLDSSRTSEVLRIKSVILNNIGHIAEACEVIDYAMTLDSDSVALANMRSHMRTVKRDDPFFQHLQQLEAQVSKRVGNEKTDLCFALAKAYLDIGSMESAAKYYATAGANIQQSLNYNEQDNIELYKAIKQDFRCDYLQRLAAFGSQSDKPIFIVGMERSGTTLIEQILASHPSVFPGGELSYFAYTLGGFTLPSGSQFAENRVIDVEPGSNLLERAERYLQQINSLPGYAAQSHVTDKMPTNFEQIGMIHAMFPNARIIHCRRDPVDTCISCYTTQFISGTQWWSFNLTTVGQRYRAYWDLMEHWRKELPGRFLELRYEQVVENTEQTARTLLDWCGLPWDDRVMKFYETERPVRTASVTQVRQPIYKSSMGRWKKWEPYIQPLLAEIGDIEKQYWAELG